MRTWKRFAAGLVAVAAFAVPGAASADHGCNGDVTTVGGPDGGVVYIDDRGGDGLWIYAETNGEAGLQSGGYHALNGTPVPVFGEGYNDPGCNHENPDALLF